MRKIMKNKNYAKAAKLFITNDKEIGTL
jgi:hypothetical protein